MQHLLTVSPEGKADAAAASVFISRNRNQDVETGEKNNNITVRL
jgi:hypothetical protein